MKSKTNIQQVALFFALFAMPYFAFSQSKSMADTAKVDKIKQTTQFSGVATVTNNGISLVPTFSLGKPAAIFNFAAKGERLSFEPELDFAIEGAKPWGFMFWVRYKLIQSDKFKLNIGTHPAFVFSDIATSTNGISKNLLTADRYWAAEISPSYLLSKDLSVGLYYLYGRGLNEGITLNSHFLGINGALSNIKLSDQFSFRLIPMLFYLKLDGNEGTYLTSTFTLTKNNCPFSISSVVTKSIKTNIQGDSFVWNVSLAYAY